ncbi:MAG: hypothetical protein A2Y62_00875 [Candidatus Fischerbacteria bacterium RBG_13_37_8]|uniref:DUF4241 domain-containing protein n=1 Tax=Candidatus Fischerbacteria bacterium RBG_13_37_8 TaxID=1817863 RepID=A0A1F5VJN9_9BACT|nr:MAG: hypothetical protein A2Y62_00875 [Candidatus Fischerbacteria bacterium RBG_13_37_8]
MYASRTDFTILEKAFVDGSKLKIDNQEITIRVLEAGILKVPGGYIVACDPFVMVGDTSPFAMKVVPGQYPVQIAVTSYENGDERIALARISFSKEKAERWEIAIFEGQDINALEEEEEVPAYGVDSATGSFMDKQGAAKLNEKMLTEGYTDYLFKELDRTYKNTRSWAVIDYGSANIIMFSSGCGDGFYISYWGYDSSNNLVSLTTDFEIL